MTRANFHLVLLILVAVVVGDLLTTGLTLKILNGRR